jgi:hypothetical protein
MKTARNCCLVVGLAIAIFATVPAHTSEPEDTYSALRPGLGWAPTAELQPTDVLSIKDTHPLARTAFFRFMDRLPLRPTSIGPEPRLPYERAPAMGLLFYVALN